MNDIIQTANLASQQTDRWLFITTLLILMGGAVWAFRILMKDRADVIADYKESRADYQKTLREIINEQSRISGDFKVSMDRNTVALNANSRLLEKNV